MRAKLQKIIIKTLNLCEWEEEQVFIGTGVYHRTNLFERYKSGVFKTLF